MRRMLLTLSFAMFCSTAQAASGEVPDNGDDNAVLLAAAKKKKKKKKKFDDEGGEFGPTDVEALSHTDDSGVGVHRNQEGIDTPYKAEATLLTDLSFLNIEVDGADPISNTIIDVAVEWLFIIGQMEIGPDVSYKSFTEAVQSQTVNEDGEPETAVLEQTQSGYSVGGTFKWNFGNIDTDDLVFFAYGGVGYRAAESQTGDFDPAKSSGTVFKAGGGVNIFIDSNIAFNPRGEFRMETDTPDVEDAKTTTTSGIKALLGIAVFI